jgi:hypothetical protein
MFLQNIGICLQVHIALQPRTTSVVKRFVDSILLSDPLKGHFTCFYFLIQRSSMVPHVGHFPIGLDRLCIPHLLALVASSPGAVLLSLCKPSTS